jgi:hypothetical protein
MFHPQLTACAVFFGNSLYMFEGVGLVVPLEISLKDPSKFRFLFSAIVYLFSVFCMIIGVLVCSPFRISLFIYLHLNAAV